MSNIRIDSTNNKNRKIEQTDRIRKPNYKNSVGQINTHDNLLSASAIVRNYNLHLEIGTAAI